jgi:hypothetical protein
VPGRCGLYKIFVRMNHVRKGAARNPTFALRTTDLSQFILCSISHRTSIFYFSFFYIFSKVYTHISQPIQNVKCRASLTRWILGALILIQIFNQTTFQTLNNI